MLHRGYHLSISVWSWDDREMRTRVAGRQCQRSNQQVQSSLEVGRPVQFHCGIVSILSHAEQIETHGIGTLSEMEVLRLPSGSFSPVLGCGEIGVANCAGLEATGLRPPSGCTLFGGLARMLFLVVEGYLHSTRRRLQARHCGVSPEQRTFCSRQPSHALLARRLSGRASAAEAGD